MDRGVKFGAFELDRNTCELHRAGIRIHLRRQSAQILAMLLERPGEVVTREEIRQRLWPDGTVVEFEHSVNSAVNRLREVLGDSVSQPRYIETLPRLGYRFIGTLDSTVTTNTASNEDKLRPATVTEAASARSARRGWSIGSIAAGLLVVTGAIGAWRAVTPALSIRSVVVLPLVNLSHDAEQEYFADGMTEALTADLGRLDRIRVISRTSAMTYKASSKPLPVIAKELNVDAVVEGSVLRSADRVRIVAQLIDAQTDQHLWSGSYERHIREVLQIQTEVANAIAREVRSTLVSGPAAGARPNLIQPGAYEAYLKGMFHLNQYTAEGFEKGIGHLRQAIANDPNDPHPHAALALGYAMMGHERVPDALTLVKASARRSLELGGNLPEAYAALGMQEMYSDWDMEAGARNLRRAIDLNPNFAEARRNYAWYLRYRGDREAGIAELKHAKAIDPLAPQIVADLAWHYLLDGDYDAAWKQAREALDVNPTFSQALALMSWIHVTRGESVKAVETGRRVADRDPSWRWALGRTYACVNRKAEARALAKEIARNPQPMDQWGLAVVYSALGDKDEAMYWLEAAYRSRFSWMPWNDGFRATPGEDLFAALRDDPRYQKINMQVRRQPQSQ